MAVAVRIPPAAVLELDAPMFDALELEAAAAARREAWSPLVELGATQAELVSALLVAYLAGHGVKGSQLPKPLRIPRPADGDADDVDAAGASSSTSTSSSASAKQGGAASFASRFIGRVQPAAPAGEV